MELKAQGWAKMKSRQARSSFISNNFAKPLANQLIPQSMIDDSLSLSLSLSEFMLDEVSQIIL